MKRSQKGTNSILSVLLSMALALLIAGCGGGGGGSAAPAGGGGTATTTTISGKVTLSSTVTGKPTMMATMLNKARLQQAGKGNKPAASQGSNLLKALSAGTLSAPTALSSATIELYDADKPDWLSPVAIALADGTGTYTLSALINAASNLNAAGTAAYVDGAAIPTGNYTVIASKYDSGYGKLFVAVQAIVKKFAGTVAGNDLVAQDSDAIPTVVSMIGLSKNSDGTFGSSTTPVPVNANIQVTFSMAMARQSVIDGMKIVSSVDTTTPLAGKWKVAPDLTAVTFYPTSDLTPNTVYTITVGGGKSLKTAKNVYGKAIAADVKASFKSSPKDSTPPSVTRNSPASAIANNMPITTPIRIGADEEMDITSIAVTSSPSIGDKPAIKYVGKSTAAADINYPYIYEIVPSSTLQLATTYAIGVSGGLDMAGNMMVGSTPVNFTTETTSAGITGAAGSTTAAAQLGAKDVLGKWVNAMNARNSALLASYMSGDFFWINDTSTHGMQSEDLNRDGRLSLNEFTGMLDNWFKDLDRCGSTVTGDVATADANVANGIAVNGSTATIAFTITATPTNTTDSTCNDSGPKSTLYAVMENINQAWLMTRGSEIWLATYPAALTPIDLVAPANGNQFADPSLSATPLIPEFKWTAVASDTAGTPASTYLVVLIDNKSRQLRTGWAALVDGSTTVAGSPIAAKFNGMPGDYGNMIVLCMDQSCPKDNPLGFDKMITEIKPGGSYSWAVIGFKTKTLADFKNINFDPATYLAASSANNGFTVNGVWKELTVKVVGSPSSTTYTYSDNAGGYNVGADSSVTLTVTTPNAAALTANVSVNGYISANYSQAFSGGTASVTITLSDNRNWVQVCDDWVSSATGPGNCIGLAKDFGIFTTNGAAPKIVIGSVSATKCAAAGGGPATLGTQDAWGNYSSPDACTVDVSGTVDPSITGTSLSVNVWNNNGNGSYNQQVAVIGGSYSATGIPVYAGQNWVSISNWNNLTSVNNQNGFGVDTQAGSTFVAPISATVTGATMTSSDMWQSYWDAGTNNSVTVNVTMPFNTGTSGNYSFCSDPNYTCHGSPVTITGTSSPITVNLYTGWNYINLHDSADNWYMVNIYTTGGTFYTPPNLVTGITDGANPVTPTASYGYYTYSTAACSVTVSGTTTSAGAMNVYLNYYNSTTGASVFEWQTVTPTGTSYVINQAVYGGGTNTIDIQDANWNWQGVQVTTTCSNVPVAFGFSAVTDSASTALSPDVYGTYNTTGQSVNVTGTATTGKIITAYVSGMYYGTYTSPAAAGSVYAMNIPLYTGYNYISLTDGSSWSYLNVYTTSGGATYTAPISNVTVSGSTLSSGGGASDTWSSWNTSLGTVNITGSSTVTGAGSWSQSGAVYNSGVFNSSGGTFSLSGVILDFGYNYFTLYDANWNAYYLTIYTSGGASAPVKVVAITSPAQSAAITSGSAAVTGTIATASFTPAYIYGYVYDYTTYVSTYYYWDGVTDAATIASWGYQPLTYSAGTFSFNATVNAGNITNIEAYAYDTSGMSHGHYIYVNNTFGYTDYSWKPGSKATPGSAKAKAHRTEFIKKMMSRKAR